METTRQNKISRLLQKTLGDIFIKMTKTHFGNALITVTNVRVTPDLSIAKVYLSIYTLNSDKSAILPMINSMNSEIRYELGIKTGKQLRIIPALEFFIDDSLDYIENIEKLLKK
jgi:ribosome-binding factor A